jgi:hypothetical protein
MSLQVRLQFQPDLERRLSSVASAHGATISALSYQWILEGLERLEASRESRIEGGLGMCSVRTDISGPGPTPLPLQQSVQSDQETTRS